MSVTRTTDRATGAVTYVVRAYVDGVRATIGRFDTEAEAAEADAAATACPGSPMTLAAWGRTWLRRREKGGLVKHWKKDVSRWHSLVEPRLGEVEIRKLTRQDVVRWVRWMLRKEADRGGDRRDSGLAGLGRSEDDCARGGGEHRSQESGRSGGRSRRRPGADPTGAVSHTLGRSTVSNALNLLRVSLQDAADEGHCARNVARDVRVPKVPAEDEPHVFLSLDELAALLSCPLPHRAAEQARPIFTVLAYTALRPGELWRLRAVDVVLDGRPELVVRTSKNGRSRRVPLLGPARDTFRSWLRAHARIGNALVFPGEGGRVHCEGYDAGWPSWRAAAGVNPRARLYDLRHTCASHLVMGSGSGYPSEPWSIERVSVFLGHSDIKVTQRHYARFVPGWLDGPAERARKEWEEGRG